MGHKNETARRITPADLVHAFPEGEAASAQYKDTAQNRVYLALKEAVLAGQFLPGAIVTLRRLSEMLGTSETPVREAVKRLTAEGAFEALPNRSARIPRPSRRRVLQIFDLRVELEGKAAEQATENISQRQIGQLVALQEKMNRKIEAGDTAAYTALNTQFHFLIYRAADNEPLLTLIEMLWLRTAPLLGAMNRIAAARPVAGFRTDQSHHDVLISALENRDAASVKLALQADLFSPEELPEYWDALELVEPLAPISIGGNQSE